jgi:phosphoenolpyruvate carboxykinase (ATP)
MKLKYTRAIVDAIHNGSLVDTPTLTDPTFGLAVPTSCDGVPSEILLPRNTWSDKNAFDATAKKLAKLFVENFSAYADAASDAILSASPKP